MKLAELLQEGYKEVTQKFIKQTNNKDLVDNTIQSFRALVNKNQISDTKQKNIDYWGKQDFKEFQKFVNRQSSIPSNRKLKQLQGHSLTLLDNEEWLIVVPYDLEASCYYGRNTDWCISKPNKEHFFDYVYQDKQIPIFCINKLQNEKWAIVYNRANQLSLGSNFLTIYDSLDNVTPKTEFEKETGMSIRVVLQLVIDNITKIKENIQKHKQQDPHILINQVFDAKTKQRNEQLEQVLAKTRNVSLAADYLRYFEGSGIKVEVPLSNKTIINAILNKEVDQFQIPQCWLDNNEIMQEVILHSPQLFSRVSSKLKNMKQIAKQLLKQDPYNISYMPDEIKKDQELMIEILKKNTHLIMEMPQLRNDKTFILKVAKLECGSVIRYVSDETLLDDKNIIMTALQTYSKTLMFASERLRDDYDIVKASVQQDGNSLLYASTRLKDNKKIALLAIKNNKDAFLCLNSYSPLRNDPEIRKAADYEI